MEKGFPLWFYYSGNSDIKKGDIRKWKKHIRICFPRLWLESIS